MRGLITFHDVDKQIFNKLINDAEGRGWPNIPLTPCCVPIRIKDPITELITEAETELCVANNWATKWNWVKLWQVPGELFIIVLNEPDEV